MSAASREAAERRGEEMGDALVEAVKGYVTRAIGTLSLDVNKQLDKVRARNESTDQLLADLERRVSELERKPQ